MGVGDRTGALKSAEAAVVEYPQSAHAWNLRGWVYLENHWHDEAEEDLKKAIAIDPAMAVAMSNLGIVRRNRQDVDGAFAWFERALATDPREPKALRERGRIRADRGDFAGARADLELGASIEPGDEMTWKTLGWVAASSGDWKRAEECYSTALRIAEPEAWTYTSRALANANLGRIDETLADLCEAHNLSPVDHEFDVAIAAQATRTARAQKLVTGIPVNAYLAQAEHLRGLESKTPVSCSVVSQAAASDRVSERGAEEVERSEEETVGLRRLGLVRPTTADVGQARADARRAQIAGYYDPSTKALCVVGEGDDSVTDESVIIHELVHALQDQHFGLPAFRLRSYARAAPGVADDDLELATRSISEGDATLVQTIWQVCTSTANRPRAAGPQVTTTLNFIAFADPVAFMQLALAQTKRSAPGAEQALNLDPYAVITELAPYLLGAAYVDKVRSRGGWEAVAALYENPPRTMEQILHPAKPGAPRDEPTPIPLVELAPPEGWTLTDARVLGELNAAILVRTHGAKWNAARSAAKGWDGDLLLAFRTEAGADAIIWATTWDTPADAAKFAAAHAVVIPSKDANAGARTTRTLVEDGAVVTWVCGPETGGTGRTILRGREFFVVEGFSEAESAALEATLLATPIPHVD